MGRLKRFNAVLSRQNAIYHAGEELVGLVALCPKSPIEVLGLVVEVRGATYLEIPGWETGSTVTHNHTHLDLRFNIYEPVVDGDTGRMLPHPAVDLVHRFRCRLPPALPCSFRHKQSRVAYRIRAGLVLASGTQYTHPVRFTMLGVADPDILPPLINNTRQESEKFYRMLETSSSQGPLMLTVKFTTDKHTYVPSEQVHLEYELKNWCLSKVFAIITLQMCMTFKAPTSQQYEERTVKTFALGTVAANGTKQGDDIKFNVPVVPPTGLPYCELIDVNYCFALELEYKNSRYNLTVPFGITIRPIPLSSAHLTAIQRSTQPPGPGNHLPPGPLPPYTAPLDLSSMVPPTPDDQPSFYPFAAPPRRAMSPPRPNPGVFNLRQGAPHRRPEGVRPPITRPHRGPPPPFGPGRPQSPPRIRGPRPPSPRYRTRPPHPPRLYHPQRPPLRVTIPANAPRPRFPDEPPPSYPGGPLPSAASAGTAPSTPPSTARPPSPTDSLAPPPEEGAPPCYSEVFPDGYGYPLDSGESGEVWV